MATGSRSRRRNRFGARPGARRCGEPAQAGECSGSIVDVAPAAPPIPAMPTAIRRTLMFLAIVRGRLRDPGQTPLPRGRGTTVGPSSRRTMVASDHLPRRHPPMERSTARQTKAGIQDQAGSAALTAPLQRLVRLNIGQDRTVWASAMARVKDGTRPLRQNHIPSAHTRTPGRSTLHVPPPEVHHLTQLITVVV